MEKFTIDLDKVLDDFEDAEEKSIGTGDIVPRKRSFGEQNSLPCQYMTISDSHESTSDNLHDINLDDADFGPKCGDHKINKDVKILQSTTDYSGIDYELVCDSKLSTIVNDSGRRTLNNLTEQSFLRPFPLKAQDGCRDVTTDGNQALNNCNSENAVSQKAELNADNASLTNDLIDNKLPHINDNCTEPTYSVSNKQTIETHPVSLPFSENLPDVKDVVMGSGAESEKDEGIFVEESQLEYESSIAPVTSMSDNNRHPNEVELCRSVDSSSETFVQDRVLDAESVDNAVGFGDTNTDAVDDAEMIAYLANIEATETISTESEDTSDVRHHDLNTEYGNKAGAQSLNDSDSELSNVNVSCLQKDSNDISIIARPASDNTAQNVTEGLEKFHIPLNSPCPYSYPITTQIEDPGFSKVPGNVLEAKNNLLSNGNYESVHHDSTSVLQQSEKRLCGDEQLAVNNVCETVDALEKEERSLQRNSSPGGGVGARPKDIVVSPVPLATFSNRIPRPNSLLGLSKPTLPNEMLSFVETMDSSGAEPVDKNDLVVDSTEHMEQTLNTNTTSLTGNTDDSVANPMQPISSLRNPPIRPVRPNSFPLPSQGSPTNKLKRPTSLNLTPRDYVPVNDQSSDISSSECTPTPAFSLANDIADSSTDVMGVTTTTVPPNVGGPGTSPTSPNQPKPHSIVSQLGKVAPIWIPDSATYFCMMCDARFTFTRRRHHCRACGKVFCSSCCNMKIKLPYLENKENRVCQMCYQSLTQSDDYAMDNGSDNNEGNSSAPAPSPNPNNPSEYCSTIPPLQQAQANLNTPPPTVMVPVGVLKRQGSIKRSEPKTVMFSDGIRPGGDLTELDGSADVGLPARKPGRSARKVEKSPPDGAAPDATNRTKTKKLPDVNRNVCLIPDSGLPPVVLSDGDFSMEEEPDPEKIIPRLRSEDPNPVVFAINKNLFVLVKIINLDCCIGRICWCFTTRGMCTVGQDEIIIVLECLSEEKTIPRDVFCHLNTVYEEASKGNTVSDLGHTIFGQSFLGSREHGGFLYVRPTFQCLKKLILPEPPYIFGVLLQKWETPWAKVFPLRLMLRLGAEYRYYPCPLVSVRYRNSVYGEIGHTIMNLLADFREYQYMLPQIKGVVVHMEDKQTFINFPRNRYEDVMKVINNSNDHVMALGTSFSMEADSHLVCIQNEEGNYQTQAINIQNKPRKVTGASFIVFNGALKTSSGLTAKSSIVEDGLMVQITGEAMVALKQNIRDMKDFTIKCGSLQSSLPDETVYVKWVDDDKNLNTGIKSPVDEMLMDGINSIHIHNATDYVGEKRTIRWTEVFFIQVEDSVNSRCEPVDLSRLAEMLAKAACIALVPQLDNLKDANIHKLGLRVTIDADRVGYEIGANGQKLPSTYMNELDNELIPVIHTAASNNHDSPVIVELIFHILE